MNGTLFVTQNACFFSCTIGMVVIIILPSQLAILWDCDYAEYRENFIYELILKKKKNKSKKLSQHIT